MSGVNRDDMAMDFLPLIDRYARGPSELRASVSGLTDAELDAFPVPGTWSIRQIVVHVMHAELFNATRILQTFAEEHPLVMNWDENLFASRIPAERIPLEACLLAVEGIRGTTAPVLRAMKPDDFDRVCVHSRAGKRNIGEMISYFTDHLPHHVKFIDMKRKLLGK
jgi:hypothetical protein